MRLLVLCILFVFTGHYRVLAQDDTAGAGIKHYQKPAFSQIAATAKPDSAALAQIKRRKFVEDSISMMYLVPDPKRENQFLKQVLSGNSIDDFTTVRIKQKSNLQTGSVRYSRNSLAIEIIICLLIYTSVLNMLFNKEIKGVIQSFYNKNMFLQFDKESTGINFRAFTGLFVLFSFSLGLFIYQLTVYKNLYPAINGFRLFFTISLGIALIFSFKFLLLKLLGIIFDINRVVGQYITIINLTYFNTSFLLLLMAICFSLISYPLIPYLLIFTIVSVVVIFAWQYIGNSVNVISNFRFHKFYLFIYLCALEISPVLILIKALDI